MMRLFSILSAFSVLMILAAGVGVYWVSVEQITQSKHDTVEAVAKGVAIAIAAQVNLLTDTLEKMAQDPEVLAAVVKANPSQLTAVAEKLEKHLPGILNVRLLLPDIDDGSVPKMGYADLDMVREAFKKNQLPSIHVESGVDRHLAITRRIMQNDRVVGVLLAGFNDDFIKKTLQAADLKNGSLELKQATLVLSAAGDQISAEQGNETLVNVANTMWQLHCRYSGSAGFVQLTGVFGIIVIPALLAVLACFMVWRKLSELLSQDLASMLKAYKDMMTNKLQGDYPVKLTEMVAVISNLVQFKRVMDNHSNDITLQ